MKRLLEKARKNQHNLEAFGDMNIDKFEWVSFLLLRKLLLGKENLIKNSAKILLEDDQDFNFKFNLIIIFFADGWRQEGKDGHNHFLRNFTLRNLH